MKGEEILRFIAAAHGESQRVDRYLPWRMLRYRTPPAELSHQEWWWGIKLQRVLARIAISLQDTQGGNFTYALNPCMSRLLHLIDMQCGGAARATRRDVSKLSYLLHSLEEESIMSSIVEGAVTTRAEAKLMIRQNRRPLNKGERMVYNNYKAMQFIQEQRDSDFSPELICELHRIVTQGTLETSSHEGALRRQEDEVRVEHSVTQEIVHLPPPAEQLLERMKSLCDFANKKLVETQEGFTHPLIRACILHFWLAYDHPFVDGNGRTARALFYWAMLRAGYGNFEYISISREILNTASDYYDAFTDAEQDDGDLNYFIIQQLQVIHRAVESLHSYIEGKKKDLDRLHIKLRDVAWMNQRQQAVILELLRDASMEYTAVGLADMFQVTKQTARSDLNALVERGLVVMRARGKVHLYGAVAGLEEQLKGM